MKRFLSFLIMVSLGAHFSAAQETFDVKLSNGTSCRVSVCSDEVFRVRFSADGAFGESLMERYGIIRTEWDKTPAKVIDKAGRWSVTNGKYTLVIDKKSQALTVADESGWTVLGPLKWVKPGDRRCVEMAGVINGKYADLHVPSNGGIIGDDDGKFSEKDKAESGDPDKSSMVSIALKENERIYGGGSTSREHIQHRGEMLRMWATYQHTEIPMPFVMSSEGWGVYDNSTRKTFFDIAYTDKNTLNVYDTFDESDFFLLLGGNMPAVLNNYTQVTGRTYVLPKWAYGLCFGPNMREDQWDILNDAVHFRQAGVPCDLFWLEPQWMAKRYDFSTSKQFNYDKFSPEPYWLQDKEEKQLYPRLFIGKLRSMGFHLGLWLCEEYDLSIAEEDAIAIRAGRDTSGMEHWMNHLSKFVDLGVEGFKLDPARTIDEHTFWNYYNGATDREMHNLNQILLPKQLLEMYRAHTGKRSWHHYCAGWSGTQHWSASTSGDNGGGKTALYDQLNLGMSGYMNTSCDVMSVPRELEMQSLHFGTFLPWVQINSWFSMMHPFYYGEQEQDIYRKCIKFRYSIAPYIYSSALEGALTGMPIVRAMPLEFPGDRNVDDMAYQYMFGPSLCVGIFSDEIYLPEGEWTDAWTGEKIVSRGETVKRSYPEDRAGLLFIREGSIIPCQKDVQYIGNKAITDYIVRFYPHGESSYTMLDSDAESFGYEQGLIARTRFDCSEIDGETTLTVNPVEGSFENMPQTRSYTIEVALDEKPQSVWINDAIVRDWLWDGRLTVELNDVDVSDKFVVKIK